MNLKHFRICQITLSLGKGGAERSCALLSRMLQDHGHEVHTVVLTDEVDFDFSGELFNLGKFKTENDTLPKRLARFKKLRNYLKKNRFDVIIDHRPKNEYWREVFYDRYVYRNIPRIFVVHSSLQKNYFSDRPKKMVNIYHKNVASVAVSKHIEEYMKKLGVKNTALIHNAIDSPSSILPKGKEVISPPSEGLGEAYLLWYGRIHEEVKDLSFLLKSYSVSKLWKKGIYLVIMGNGKDKEKLKKQAADLPCGRFVKFLPFTKNPFPIISEALAAVLTSKYEGFPMVLVESLSVGTPVVSLDIVSGPSEVIDHQKNGLLVGERNIDLFAEALREICFDEELYQICIANAKASVAEFSLENMGGEWDVLLQKKLDKKIPPSSE